jgi:hypothetical protein
MTRFVLTSTTSSNLRGSLTESWSAPWLRVTPNLNPSAGSGSGIEVEKEKADKMEMSVPRSNAYGRQPGCSRHTVHDVLGVHGWVAVTSSGRHNRGFLHGSLDVCLHGHGPVSALAALPSIQFL